MVSLIGLGIAIDYSLLVVYRYREERRAGRPKEDAIVRTMTPPGAPSSSAARPSRSGSR